jgi:dihydrofolate synthase/folylpolyglutamate synthase
LLDKARELACPFFLRGRDFDLEIGERTGNGAVAMRKARSSCMICRCSICRWKTPRWRCRPICCWVCRGMPADRCALLATRVVGRLDRRSFDWHGKRLNLLLDVGHNPHAAEYLARRLSRRRRRARLAVFGLLADKDLDGVSRRYWASVQHWAVAPLDSPRAPGCRTGAGLAEPWRIRDVL